MENSVQGLKERKKFLNHGELGDLLYDPDSILSVRRWNVVASHIFDNTDKKWIKYDPELIPDTYTLVPAPSNVLIELDYFVRSIHVVNHRYVWALPEFEEKGMPREILGKLFTNSNQKNQGRYIFREQVPTLQNPARMVKFRFVEQDQKDIVQLI